MTVTSAGRSRVARALLCAGLVTAGAGFLTAGVDPGDGPRLVRQALTLGPFYGPPAIAGVVVAVVGLLAGLVRRRWAVVLGVVVAVLLVLGSATFGLDGLGYRLSRPRDVVPLAGDVLQIVGQLVALAGGGYAVLRRGRAG